MLVKSSVCLRINGNKNSWSSYNRPRQTAVEWKWIFPTLNDWTKWKAINTSNSPSAWALSTEAFDRETEIRLSIWSVVVFSGRLFPCIRLLSIMANSGSWKRMKRVFFPWGKKNRNQPPPPPAPSFDELTSSPGIQCFSFNFDKTWCLLLFLGFLVCFQHCMI